MNIAVVNLITSTTVLPMKLKSLMGLKIARKPNTDEWINIVRLCKRMAEFGNNVVLYVSDVFLPEKTISGNIPGLTIRYLPTRLTQVFSPAIIPFTPSLYKELISRDFDIILASETLQIGSILAILAGIRKKIPVIIWQEVDVWPPQYILRFAERFYYTLIFKPFLIKKIRGIIGRSSSAIEFLKSIGICEDKILGIIPTPIDTTIFKPIPKNEARVKLCLPLDRPILLCVTTLDKRRGLDLLLLTIEKVTQKIPEVLLLIKGNGPLRENLETTIEKKGLKNNVRIDYSYTAAPEMPLFYSAADISLVVTEFGLLPFSALESLACGIPVISTFKRGLKDFIIDEETGFLVDRDPDLLANKIIKILRYNKFNNEKIIEFAKKTIGIDRVISVFREVFGNETKKK